MRVENVNEAGNNIFETLNVDREKLKAAVNRAKAKIDIKYTSPDSMVSIGQVAVEMARECENINEVIAICFTIGQAMGDPNMLLKLMKAGIKL